MQEMTKLFFFALFMVANCLQHCSYTLLFLVAYYKSAPIPILHLKFSFTESRGVQLGLLKQLYNVALEELSCFF